MWGDNMARRLDGKPRADKGKMRNVKHNIGTIVNGLKIIETSSKGYLTKCTICGYECIKRSDIIDSTNCGCCSMRVFVPEINSIYNHKEYQWMLQYFYDINDSKINMPNSQKVVKMRCPFCGQVQNKKIINIKKEGFTCDFCSCKYISKPERLMSYVLSKNNIDYIKQYNIKGEKYRYDFYLPLYDIIIETHGGQHYGKANFHGKVSNCEDVHENDISKWMYAELKMGKKLKYVIVDCRYSDFNYMLNNIYQNTTLAQILKERVYAEEVIKMLDYDNTKSTVWDYIINNINDENITSKKLSLLFDISIEDVRKIIKDGEAYGILPEGTVNIVVDNSKIERDERARMMASKRMKAVIITAPDGNIINCKSLHEAESYMTNILNKNVSRKVITSRCKNGRTYDGYKFEFSPETTERIDIQNG